MRGRRRNHPATWPPTGFLVMLLHGATWIYARCAFMGFSFVDLQRVVLDLRLVQVLHAAVALWLVLRARDAIPAHTGHALALAIFGVMARLLAGFARDGLAFLADGPMPFALPQARLVDALGLTAFATGLLATVIAAWIGRRR